MWKSVSVCSRNQASKQPTEERRAPTEEVGGQRVEGPARHRRAPQHGRLCLHRGRGARGAGAAHVGVGDGVAVVLADLVLLLFFWGMCIRDGEKDGWTKGSRRSCESSPPPPRAAAGSAASPALRASAERRCAPPRVAPCRSPAQSLPAVCVMVCRVVSCRVVSCRVVSFSGIG